MERHPNWSAAEIEATDEGLLLTRVRWALEYQGGGSDGMLEPTVAFCALGRDSDRWKVLLSRRVEHGKG